MNGNGRARGRARGRGRDTLPPGIQPVQLPNVGGGNGQPQHSANGGRGGVIQQNLAANQGPVRDPATAQSPGFNAWANPNHTMVAIGRGVTVPTNQGLEGGATNRLPANGFGGARPKTNISGNQAPPTNEMSQLAVAEGPGRGRGSNGTSPNGSPPILSEGRGRSRIGGRTPTVGGAQGGSQEPPPSGEPQGGSGGDRERRGMGQRRPRYADMDLPRTPETCTAGQTTIQLFTNHFHLETMEDFIIYHYNVEYTPYTQSAYMRKGMMRELDLFGEFFMFDGVALFSRKKLPSEVTEKYAIRRSDDEKVKIAIRLIREIVPGTSESIFIWNNVFKKLLKILGLQEIGRGYFLPNLAIEIKRYQMELWPGYSTAIQSYDGGPMLTVDVCYKFLNTRTVYKIMEDLHNTGRNEGEIISSIIREIVGNSVLTRYNNKMYVVQDIDFDNNPVSKFVNNRGEEMTYVQYFAKQYNLTIENLQQPLLVVNVKDHEGKKKQVCLIPELCLPTGIPESLNSNTTSRKELMKETCLSPGARAGQLRKLVDDLNQNEAARGQMEAWGMNISNNLNEVTARQLPNERILFGKAQGKGSRQQPSQIHGPDFSNGFKSGVGVLVPQRMQNWLLVYPTKYARDAANMLNCMRRLAYGMNIELDAPQEIQLQQDRTGDYISALRAKITPAEEENSAAQTHLVVAILGTKNSAKYQAVKKLCCTECPVPSQMVVAGTIRAQNRLMSVTTNIIVQITCKLGGIPWALDIPIKKGGVMVVGIDTYHDTRSRNSSAAGFVASYDHTLTRYYSKCKFVTSGCDLHDHLEEGMKGALKQYHKVNRGTLPDRIIVYRDGLGDGQVALSTEHEVPQMKRGVKSIYGEQMPKMSYIIVKKRVGTRFFLARGNNQYENPPGGTVVDTNITNPLFYDFFLVPQNTRQGCVTPCHYIVVADDSGWRADIIQKLTYKLTHLYFNWQGTIRVPAPVMYAHKIAYLHGTHLHTQANNCLDDKLYYL